MKYGQPIRGSPLTEGSTTSYGTYWQELTGRAGSSYCFAKCGKGKVKVTRNKATKPRSDIFFRNPQGKGVRMSFVEVNKK